MVLSAQNVSMCCLSGSPSFSSASAPLREIGMRRLATYIRLWMRSGDSITPGLASIYVFLACVLIFLMTQVNVVGGDSPGIAYLTVSLLKEGTFRLDGFINQNPFFDLQRAPHYVVESQGHYYSKFSPLPSLMATPVYAIGLALAPGVEGDIQAEAALYMLLSRVAAVVLSSAVTVAVFLLLRFLVKQSEAMLLALAYALGTFTWASATNTLAAQSSGELLMACAPLRTRVLRSECWSDMGRRSALGVAGLLLGLAVAARPQLVPSAALLGIYAMVRARHDGWSGASFVLGALIIAALWGTYNVRVLGHLCRPVTSERQ